MSFTGQSIPSSIARKWLTTKSNILSLIPGTQKVEMTPQKPIKRQLFPSSEEKEISGLGRDLTFQLGRSMTWLRDHPLDTTEFTLSHAKEIDGIIIP